MSKGNEPAMNQLYRVAVIGRGGIRPLGQHKPEPRPAADFSLAFFLNEYSGSGLRLILAPACSCGSIELTARSGRVRCLSCGQDLGPRRDFNFGVIYTPALSLN